jgi:hypothetical protein
VKILHLYTAAGGVAQWRLEIPATALREAGHEVIGFHGDNHAFEDIARVNNDEALPTLCKLMETVDVVHVGYSDILQHTELLVQMREYSIRNGRGVPFLTDIDDDLINVPTYNLGYKSYHPGAPGRKVALLQMHVSDGLVVSTVPLGKVLAPHARAVYHLPNLDDARLWVDLPYDPARAEDKSIRLLFAGGQGRFGDLAVLQEPLEWAMAHYDGRVHSGERRPKLRTFFVACTPDWASKWMGNDDDPTQNSSFHIWHSDPKTYRATLAYIAPDIMVNPVVTNPFNASKSCLKAYEASHVGAAFLCTDWPTHDPLPQEVCLKVSNTPTQWKESLGQLIEDKALRTRLSKRLSEFVLENCQIGPHIHLWESAYADAIKRGPIKDLSEVVNPKAPGGGGVNADRNPIQLGGRNTII